jgi:hypothetical protein
MKVGNCQAEILARERCFEVVAHQLSIFVIHLGYGMRLAGSGGVFKVAKGYYL